jgi:hypothetical protein
MPLRQSSTPGSMSRACARRRPQSEYPLQPARGASNGQEAFNASTAGASPRFPKTLGGRTPGGTSRLSQMLAGRSPRTTHFLQQALACGKSGPHQRSTATTRPDDPETGGRRIAAAAAAAGIASCIRPRPSKWCSIHPCSEVISSTSRTIARRNFGSSMSMKAFTKDRPSDVARKSVT